MLKFLLPLLICISLPASAAETRFWQQSDFSDFEKGSPKRIAMRSDGRLFLAPETRELLDSSTPYLWAVAQDSKGNLYAGGGSPTGSSAKLFEISGGKSKVLAELEGLEIHAIAVDRQDRIYAATAPDGKVYRLTNGKSEVFFDPHAKYIWALAFSKSGDLFVATGDNGEIHRVTPAGKSSIFFRTEETHARSLAFDKRDNLIVGTDPGGLVLRITPAGEGFVLYQMPKREVTTVAVGPDGSIYAAAVGSAASLNAVTSAPSSPPLPPSSPATLAAMPAPPRAAPPSTSSSSSISGGSEVYRISTDGAPRKVWSHPQDIAYAIAFDSGGRPLIGTGNKGNVYRLDSDIWYTLLVNLAPTQVTGLLTGPSGEVYAVTGNIGRVYQIGPAVEKQGTFESEAFDGGAFTYWGKLSYTGELTGGSVVVESRSGNVNRPQKNWTPWAAVPLHGDGGRIASPASRFLQYKITLDAAADGKSPEVTAVEVAYLSKNIAPVVREIEVAPANYKFPASSTLLLSLATASAQTMTLPAMDQPRKAATLSSDSGGGSQTLTYSKGSLGARWMSQDDNGDPLVYKVEIRGAAESQWKLLRDKVRERYLSWDSTAFPDGKYVLRVSASDSPGNPPDQTLTGFLDSDPFLIDNTPPGITGLTAAASGNRIDLQWKAKDALSVIEKAEYSINGGDWIMAEPVTKLSDSPELDYKLSIDRPGPGEHTIAVRVTDEYDNQSVEKVVIR